MAEEITSSWDSKDPQPSTGSATVQLWMRLPISLDLSFIISKQGIR